MGFFKVRRMIQFNSNSGFLKIGKRYYSPVISREHRESISSRFAQFTGLEVARFACGVLIDCCDV